MGDTPCIWARHADRSPESHSDRTLAWTPPNGGEFGRSDSAATAAGIEVLRSRMHRVAVAGRLRVTEGLAIQLIHAAGTGAVLALLAEEVREQHISPH